MKRNATILLMALLALALTACSANSASSGSVEPKPVQQTTSAPVETAPSAEIPAQQAAGSSPASESQSETSDVLVVYFSATGTTKGVAERLASIMGADLYEIIPAEPYTSADLNYSDRTTRATREQNDPSARPALSGTVENMADYDVIFLGYPIWWGQAPKIMYTFVESYDLTGKTVIPFCTSGSSGIGSSATNLSASAPDAVWMGGTRFSGGVSDADLQAWIDALK